MTTVQTRSAWVRIAKLHIRCPICDHDDWCMVSEDGAAALCARTPSNLAAGEKGAGWIHRLDVPLTPHPARSAPEPVVSRAHPAVIDATYQGLLSVLQLSESHLEHLRARKLFDAEIDYLGYRSLPAPPRRQLSDRLGNLGFQRRGVPGFHLMDGMWDLAGPAGILIPVKSLDGSIQGIQVRCDHADSSRYKWISSRGYLAGSSPGVPVHVAGARWKREVWITEGPIKADIAALKMLRCVLAVPGVGNWRDVPGIVAQIRPRRVIVAYDSDKATNPLVKYHSQSLADALVGSGWKTFEAEWDSQQGKGLDDLLVEDS